MDLSITAAEVILASVCFFVAMWNAAVGPSGAITFVTMATLLPPAAVVPIHAVVEGYSALLRSILLRAFVDWRYCLMFLAGSGVGFGIGWQILGAVSLPDRVLETLLGVFIVLTTWVPLHRLAAGEVAWPALAGGVTSFLTLFVGATAPLVAALISQRHNDHRHVLGTSAVCMALQHGAKVPLFGVLGFSFGMFGKLLIVLLLSTAGGNWLGKRVLINVDPAQARKVFKVVVTILGAKLVIGGLTGA